MASSEHLFFCNAYCRTTTTSEPPSSTEMLKSWASGLPTCRRVGVSFLFREGALVHPRAVVPEIRADCCAVGPDLPGDFPDDLRLFFLQRPTPSFRSSWAL